MKIGTAAWPRGQIARNYKRGWWLTMIGLCRSTGAAMWHFGVIDFAEVERLTRKSLLRL